MTANIRILQLLSYAMPIFSRLSEPHQKLFSKSQCKNRASSFNSKILLHLSCDKNGIIGSITFHKSKLHIIYINLLPNSVFKDPFHHSHSMFQQFNSSFKDHTPLDYLSPCKLVIPHMTSNPSLQYHYINPISTEFQIRISPAACIISACIKSMRSFCVSSQMHAVSS